MRGGREAPGDENGVETRPFLGPPTPPVAKIGAGGSMGEGFRVGAIGASALPIGASVSYAFAPVNEFAAGA
jgi:hypothetical protein